MSERPLPGESRGRADLRKPKRNPKMAISASDEHPAESLSATWRDIMRRDCFHDYLCWLKPFRSKIGAVFLFALLVTALQAVEPLFARFIIDRVLLNGQLKPEFRTQQLQYTGFAFLIVILLSNLSAALRDYRQRLLNLKLMLSLRKALFRHMLHLPLPTIDEMKSGRLLSRLSGDVETTAGLFQAAIISPAISIVRLSIALGVLLALNWRLAVVSLPLIPAAVLASLIFSRRLRPIHASIRRDVEQIDGRASDAFSGIRVVRAFGKEMRELIYYLRGKHIVLRKEMSVFRREIYLWTSWGLLVSMVSVATLWYGGHLTINQKASVGDIIAFQWYIFLLLNPVWNIVNSFSELQRSLAAMERVFETLKIPLNMADHIGVADAPTVVNELRFENVYFDYGDGKPVIRNFTAAFPKGSVVAVVGKSGAGKTTLAELVARFRDPVRGRILINGTDIRDIRLKTYRDLVALVPQDVFLFENSIRNNIAYKNENASDAEVENAARCAQAHEFISNLSDRYETVIGKRGVRLSGGEQQRIAIARAILAGPQILILDEATSHLDVESEQLTQNSMGSIFADRIAIIIAHQLSTIRSADFILLLDEGNIVERGTHEELMLARGRYYTMISQQQSLN